ncbi:MAG TPA: TIGR03986 family CRISPR-associated RAMP protein [Candidatus Angelobacter sp.]|nr:TIGR03986 family CRISPR-associated RAMP protein [Candidatus Angelobacter sp.]
MGKGKKDKDTGRGTTTGSFRDKLGGALGVIPPDVLQPTTTRLSPFTSAPIRRGKDAAGRAPYNFVPLPEQVVADLSRPPDADIYEAGRTSGEIDLTLTALTDFYVRGMWSSFEEYLEQQRKGSAGGRPPLPLDPFQTGSRLRLPGSSLRGMIRSLVEILGKAPLDPVNDTQLFFRAVGSSPNPEKTSFDPNAESYRSRLVVGDGSRENPTYPKAQAGYLCGSRTGWTIRPAKKVGPSQTQWYRIEYRQDRKPPWQTKVEFLPAAARSGNYHNHPKVFYSFGIVDQKDCHLDITNRPGHYIGMLIRSGFIERKYLQWIIHEPDDAATLVPIPQYDVEDYKNDRNANVPPECRYTDQNITGTPCFYITWKDKGGRQHVSFGHTPYFRLPYRTTPQMINSARRDPASHGWDLGQLLFGRTHKDSGQSARGRVFFEDGLLTGEQKVDTASTRVVLGEPKPTTYQHYLTQDSDNGKESIYWDSDRPEARLRGHKIYWHRPGADFAPSIDQLQKEKVLTKFHKAYAGNAFAARIRFENLSRLELGLLLTAIQLPPDCRHRLGMAKPLGFGSFQVEVAGFRRIIRESRYGKWFDSAGHVCTGFEKPEESQKLISECRREFAEWYLGQKGLDAVSFEQRLWSEPRLGELRALLSWKEFQSEQERSRWLARTRYMAFGSVMERKPWGDPESWTLLNEYKQSGYPERPELKPRRPLPPAWQVANLTDQNIPEDPAPPWIPRKRLDELNRLRREREQAARGQQTPQGNGSKKEFLKKR